MRQLFSAANEELLRKGAAGGKTEGCTPVATLYCSGGEDFPKKSAHKSRRAQTARVRRAHNKAKKLVRKPLRFSAAVKTFN